jgi:hypothetical protein
VWQGSVEGGIEDEPDAGGSLRSACKMLEDARLAGIFGQFAGKILYAGKR